MSVISGLISGGLGIVQGLVDSWTQKRNVEKTVSANKELADYQYSKDLDMWNRANVYNLPENQMKRLEAAGINPALMYGNSAPGNVATTLPKYQAPSVSYNYKPALDLDNALRMYQDFEVKNAQIDNLKAQKKILDAESVVRESEAYFADFMNRLKSKKITTESQLLEIIRDWQGTMKPEVEWYPHGEYQSYGASDLLRGQMMSELYKTQAEVRGKNLDNELKQKNINWYIADKLGKAAAGALGFAGLRGIGRRVGRGNVKRITNKYYE